MRLIDADAIVFTHAIARSIDDGHNWNELCVTKDEIDDMPSAEPERKKGEWMLYESRSDIYDLEGVCTWGRAYRCSECGFMHWVIEDFGIYSFCPNCGADMRGE